MILPLGISGRSSGFGLRHLVFPCLCRRFLVTERNRQFKKERPRAIVAVLILAIFDADACPCPRYCKLHGGSSGGATSCLRDNEGCCSSYLR